MQSFGPAPSAILQRQTIPVTGHEKRSLLKAGWAVVCRVARQVGTGFRIDLRSLAVFRVVLAGLLLWDLSVALSDVKAFYSDEGVLPRSALFTTGLWSNNQWWSIHMMSGSVWVQVALFLIAAGAALALAAGWRTRLATLVSWFLLCSMDVRNPAILHGGDDTMRVMLFWSFFLPLGARWSVDARLLRDKTLRRDDLLSLPGVCMLLQVGIIYWFSIALKTDPMWKMGGSGLRVALQIDHFTKPVGLWVREHDSLCRLLTTGTVLVESFGALLAFVPWRNSLFRLAAVALFWSFHAGIWFCMDVGPFCFVMAAIWLPFLPAVFWEQMGKVQRKLFASLPGARHALLKVGAHFMRLVRRHLEPFFRKHATPNYGLRPSWLGNFLVGTCMLYSLGWNLRDTNFAKYETWLPKSYNTLGHALRWEQYWGMFSPKPLLDDGWFICVAKLTNGKEVDLLRHGTPLDWKKPKLVSGLFWDSRWQKYLANLWTKPFENCRLGMLNYLSQEWNASHDATQQTVHVKLWYVIEMTREDGTVEDTTRPVVLADYEPPP